MARMKSQGRRAKQQSRTTPQPRTGWPKQNPGRLELAAAAVSEGRITGRPHVFSRRGMAPSCDVTDDDDDDEFQPLRVPSDNDAMDLDWELFDVITCNFDFPEWTLEKSILPYYKPSPLCARSPCPSTWNPSCHPTPEPITATTKDVTANPELPTVSTSRDPTTTSKTTTFEVSQYPLRTRDLVPQLTPTSDSHDAKMDLHETRTHEAGSPGTPPVPTVNTHSEGLSAEEPSLHGEAPYSVDTGSGTDKEAGDDGSHIDRRIIPMALDEDTPGEQDLTQSPMSEPPDRPVDDEGYQDVSDADSTSAYGDSTNTTPRFQPSTDSSPETSETESRLTPGIERFPPFPVECAGGGSASPATRPGVVYQSSSTRASAPAGPKRRHDRISTERDPDDDDENEPTRKRAGLTSPGHQPVRPRFACPYQKYDPEGSPKCCMPGPRNSTGGAETFSRIKSHVLRNHNPFIWCHTCWKVCRSEDEAQRHRGARDCIQKERPENKYWLDEEQRDQIKRTKFLAGNEANWFCLFKILLPHVPDNGPNGYKTYSPYYTVTQLVYGLPTPTSEPGRGQTPPLTQKGSLTLSQPAYCSPKPDAASGPLLDDLGAYIGMDDLIQWDNIGGGFNLLDGDGNIPQVTTPPPAHPVPSPCETAQGLSQPSSKGPGPATSPSSNFFQQDNARLQESNEQLQDEVDMLRRQSSDLRGQLQPLGRSLQELLYLPSVRSGEEEVADGLFSVLRRVTAMRKTLG